MYSKYQRRIADFLAASHLVLAIIAFFNFFDMGINAYRYLFALASFELFLYKAGESVELRIEEMNVHDNSRNDIQR